MEIPFIKILLLTLMACVNIGILNGGVITNYNVDPNCPQDIIMYEFRITDCDELPCKIKREKWYTVEADFGVTRNVTNPVLKCSTVHYGRHVDLPDHGGCEKLVNASCPMVVGEMYTTATTWKVSYLAPPVTYTVYCSFVDDDGENMICGWGSGKIV